METKKTIIYGASDDLIEIDGAINDEVDAWNIKSVINASDGTRATIQYAPGHDAVWHIEVKKEGTLFERVVRGNDEDDDARHGDPDIESICKSVPIYSDVLIFKAGLEWVRVNRKKFK